MNTFMRDYRAALPSHRRTRIFAGPTRCPRAWVANLGTKVRFYGATPGMFGAEPWPITLGNNVHIVSACHFVNHGGGVLILCKDYPELEITKRINVGDKAYIGLKCTILAGTNIGNNVIIGAGSVVTRTVLNNSVAEDVPARVIKSADYLARAQANSLGFVSMSAKNKEIALKKHFGVEG